MEVAVGNFVTLKAGNATQYRFQNFFINESVTYSGENYTFMPFGFSGVVINDGGGADASLLFPNNSLSRGWADTAIRDHWLGHVRVMILDPEDKTSFTQLHQYYGQISAGRWDETSLGLTLNTVLDAVGSDIPQRKLSQRLVGDLPSTSGVRLQ